MRTIGDLIELRSFPTVIQAADVRELRLTPVDQADGAIDAFVAGYLGHDDRSQHALTLALRALTGDERGAAFFVNGVFGAGKSHLLGLLALLCDGRGHAAFAASHPNLAGCLQNWPQRLVVHFSLDDYDPARFSLEEVFWREVRAEWERRRLPRAALELPAVGSRGENFALLEGRLAEQGLQGLAVCIDELSLFLAARPVAAAGQPALQGDALFLQFLGQRAARSRLWIFAALQKNVEDIGEIESYALAQIRDRFTMLPLAVANLPAILEKRLIIRRNEPALREHCRSSFDALARALPLLDFGREEWERLYPFHPATIALLEQVVARFFSRTRSAMQFCVRAVDLTSPADQCVLPTAIFEYFASELDAHPDLRPLAEVWQSWQSILPELARDERDTAMLRRLMQGLLLFKIAGTAPSVRQLANALAFDAGLSGEANYDYARVLLERLRTRGSFLVIERHDGDTPFADRYAIDYGTRVAEMARRHIRHLQKSLPPGDARITRYMVACARDATLPLATVDNEVVSVLWRNAPRRCEIALLSASLTPAVLANRLAALAQPGHLAAALLCLLPPCLRQTAQAVSPLLETARGMADTRWRHAFIVWTPRAPTHDEMELAREATAQHILETDPALLDNRRGRAILQHIKSEAVARATALARLTTRLFHEGQLATGGGLVVDAADLAGLETWTTALEAIAELVMPHLFPRFDAIAPRLRLLTAANCEALCLDLLRRPLDAPYFAPAHERLVRAIAEPLGVARTNQGRWAMTPLPAAVADAVRSYLDDGGITYASLQAVLEKSEWGLTPEQTDVVVAAMLRQGELTAFDARGTVFLPAQIAMPLRRSVHSLRIGCLVEASVWENVVAFVGLMSGTRLPELSFAAQEQARAVLLAWCDETTAEVELARARLHQLRRQFGHAASQWAQAATTLEAIEQLLHLLKDDGLTEQWLGRIAALESGSWRAWLEAWSHLVQALDERHAALLAAHAFLLHPELVVPHEMASARAVLLAHFEAGENILANDELLALADAWRRQYAGEYRIWHGAQHDADRFAPYRRLLSSDRVRALERLATVASRPAPHAAQLAAALTQELDKGCGRDGSLRPDEPVCSSCRLRLGDRLKLRDPRELEAVVDDGVAALRHTLQATPVRDYLKRCDSGLLGWDGEGDTLLPLLSAQSLQTLEAACRARRKVQRSWSRLRDGLSHNRTRAQFSQTFHTWLDGADGLVDDDEIMLED